ncbi:hypothetical protein ACFL2V_13060 [Pseudomonadota bacterium]
MIYKDVAEVAFAAHYDHKASRAAEDRIRRVVTARSTSPVGYVLNDGNWDEREDTDLATHERLFWCVYILDGHVPGMRKLTKNVRQQLLVCMVKQTLQLRMQIPAVEAILSANNALSSRPQAPTAVRRSKPPPQGTFRCLTG